MKKVLSKALLLTCAPVMAQNISTASIDDILNSSKVIYGDDDRVEVYQASAAEQKLAASTAAMVEASSVTLVANQGTGEEYYQLNDESLADGMNVCEDERFASQPSAAMCSGFLVAPDLLVTAGHCVNSKFDCQGNVWVFDYNMDKETGKAKTKVDPKNLYKCAEIVNYKYGWDTDNDYALIQLDRVVEGRDALEIRKEGAVQVGEKITVIGHPSGLPSKVAGGAAVRSIEPREYFVANLDTFGGNSGSAVFNATTNVVEGILVRGEKDYVYDDVRGCRVVNECENDECRGEDVTKITEINELIFIDELIAAVKKADMDTVGRILSTHFNPDMHDRKGNTALMVAVENNKINVIKKLLEECASSTKATLTKASPLEYAFKNKKEEVISLFVEKMELDSAEAKMAISFAIENDSDMIIKAMIDKGLDLEEQRHGNTLVAHAVKFGSGKVAAVLLESGANKDVVVDSVTPLLHKSIGMKLTDVAKQLIEMGSNINEQSIGTGHTALHEAIASNNVEIVSTILENEPNLKAQDLLGYTPMKKARRLGRKEIKKMIRKYKFNRFFARIFNKN